MAVSCKMAEAWSEKILLILKLKGHAFHACMEKHDFGNSRIPTDCNVEWVRVRDGHEKKEFCNY